LSRRAFGARPLLPVLALVLNAFTWGVSLVAVPQLESQGLHPLWATVLIYALAVVAITLARPQRLAPVAARAALWVLVLASGTTNAAFNWAVTIGDVVRVVLLFYLMPLWAVLLARALLGERLTRRGAAARGPGAGRRWPSCCGPRRAAGRCRAGWPTCLGLLGGFSFALNNVLLRREAAAPEAARALAMFGGGALVAGPAGHAAAGGRPGAGAAGARPGLGAARRGWRWRVAFLAGNLALQYGAARLPANTTAVVMITEVLFASGLGAGAGCRPDQRTAGGRRRPDRGRRCCRPGGIAVAKRPLAARATALRRSWRGRRYHPCRPPGPLTPWANAPDDLRLRSPVHRGPAGPLRVQRGKVLLIVNTASACGFTPQFAGLEELWQDYRDRGLVVLGFPSNEFGAQDPGSNDEIASFCQLNYGVSFPMMAKVEVNGARRRPAVEVAEGPRRPGLLGSKAVKWNFTKFLVGRTAG
jgi:glutathione peroxidase-family protein/drug/metabolite transporter (DMT)-like permease